MIVSQIRKSNIWEIIRFYQAAAVNTLFGFSAYALLVWFGVNLFVSQAIAHVLGVAFNYFTYSRHVFTGRQPAKAKFVATYVLAYFANLCALIVVSRFISSPYLAGLVSAVAVSVANFVVLKFLVFKAEGA